MNFAVRRHLYGALTVYRVMLINVTVTSSCTVWNHIAVSAEYSTDSTDQFNILGIEL